MKKIKDWFTILVMLLDDVAALILVLLLLRLFRITVPLPVTIIGALLLGSLIFAIHKIVIPSMHKKEATGSEGMVGLEGTVIKPLKPIGMVKIGSEYWKAKSTSEDIDVGENVEIIGLNSLTLKVKHKDHG